MYYNPGQESQRNTGTNGRGEPSGTLSSPTREGSKASILQPPECPLLAEFRRPGPSGAGVSLGDTIGKYETNLQLFLGVLEEVAGRLHNGSTIDNLRRLPLIDTFERQGYIRLEGQKSLTLGEILPELSEFRSKIANHHYGSGMPDGEYFHMIDANLAKLKGADPRTPVTSPRASIALVNSPLGEVIRVDACTIIDPDWLSLLVTLGGDRAELSDFSSPAGSLWDVGKKICEFVSVKGGNIDEFYHRQYQWKSLPGDCVDTPKGYDIEVSPRISGLEPNKKKR